MLITGENLVKRHIKIKNSSNDQSISFPNEGIKGNSVQNKNYSTKKYNRCVVNHIQNVNVIHIFFLLILNFLNQYFNHIIYYMMKLKFTFI